MKIFCFTLFLLWAVTTRAQDSTYSLAHKLTTLNNDKLLFSTVEKFDVAFSGDEKRMAAGNSDAVLLIWDIEHGSILKDLSELSISVYDMAFTSDHKFLVTVGTGKKSFASIQVWSAETFELVKTIEHDTDRELEKFGGSDVGRCFLAMCFVGNKLITTSSEGLLSAWSTNSWELLFESNVGGNNVWDVGFSETHQTLVTCFNNTSMKLWKVGEKSFLPHTVIETGEKYVYNISISPKGEFMSVNSSGSIVLFPFDHADSIWRIPLFAPDTNITSTFWSPDGSLFYTGHYHNNILVWNVAERKTVNEVKGDHDLDSPYPMENGHNAAYCETSPSGKYLVLSNDTGFIYLFRKK